jgi:hypothetical protein
MVRRFGKLITASFFLMGIGLIVFLLTPLFLLWDIDTDILGAFEIQSKGVEIVSGSEYPFC